MKLSSRSGLLLAAAALCAVTGIVVFRSTIHHPTSAVSVAAAPLPEITLRPPSAEQEDYLRPELREALGIVAGVPESKRLDLLHSLDGEVSADECQALLHALLQARPANIPEGWHAEYIHEICLVLGRQEVVRSDFARALATIARDAGRDEVVRDYVLQHLRQLWEHAEEGLQDSIAATFREIVSGDPALAPAALLSLHFLGSPLNSAPEMANDPGQLSQGGFRIPDVELEPLVAAILNDAPSASNVVARMTAVRVARERQLSALYPGMRRIVADVENEHAVVRMAAIATLSASADPADRTFLGSLDREDPRIDSAVRHALASRP